MNQTVGRWIKAGALIFVAALVLAGCEGASGVKGADGAAGLPGADGGWTAWRRRNGWTAWPGWR